MERHQNVSNSEQRRQYARAIDVDASATVRAREHRGEQALYQDKSACNASPDCAKLIVVVGLPKRVGSLKNELALWRSFLANEIEAILRD